VLLKSSCLGWEIVRPGFNSDMLLQYTTRLELSTRKCEKYLLLSSAAITQGEMYFHYFRFPCPWSVQTQYIKF